MSTNDRSTVTARTALTNLILSRCPGGRGRPQLPGSLQRSVSVGKVEKAGVTAEGKEARENHACENESDAIAAREKEIKNCSNDDDDKNLLEDEEAEKRIKSELLETMQLLNNARVSLKLLKEIYTRRNQEKVDGMETLTFSSLKKIYGEKIVEFGGLRSRHGKIKMEVKELHKSIASIRYELDQIRGPRVQDNPWQVGVPYGYHGNGRREGGRDGSRRDGEGRRDRSRARY